MGKVRNRVGQILVALNNGRFLIGIVQFAMSWAILIKLFGLPTWWNLFIAPLSVIITWILGMIYEKSGLRKAYDLEAARYMINKMKEKENV